MRFIPSTEGPQVRDRKPTSSKELELTGAELIAEHTGNVSFLQPNRRSGEDRREGDEVVGPTRKLIELAAVAIELDKIGEHELAETIRRVLGLAA